LTGPRLPGPARAQLWTQARKAGKQLHDATVAAQTAAGRAAEAAQPDDALLEAQEKDRAWRRADLSLRLLQLGGVKRTAQQESLAAAGTKASRADLGKLADQLGRLWDDLRRQVTVAGDDLFRAERLSWIVPPLERSGPRNVSALLHRDHTRAFWRWLAE